MKQNRIAIIVILAFIAGALGYFFLSFTSQKSPVQTPSKTSQTEGAEKEYESPIILPTVNLLNPYGSGDNRILGDTPCDKVINVITCLSEKGIPTDFDKYIDAKPFGGDPEELRQTQCASVLTQLNPVRDQGTQKGCIW